MECIHLANQHCTAEIQLLGAEIASFKGPNGREVIWQGDPKVWPQHAPVLFPICGSVKDHKITIDGVTYPMTPHGFTQNAPFKLAKRGEDFAELILTPTEETRAMYPFDFVLHVTYTLLDNGFITTFLVENLSDKVMPFCIGGHPGFVCPMEDGAVFQDYQLVFPEMEDGVNTLAPGGYLLDGSEILPELQGSNTLSLSYDYFDIKDTLIFTSLKSRSVKLVHKHSGKGIELSFPKMEVLAVWSMPHKHANYVCLEPWHGMPAHVSESGRFEEKPFVTLLQPGESYKTWFTTTLI